MLWRRDLGIKTDRDVFAFQLVLILLGHLKASALVTVYSRVRESLWTRMFVSKLDILTWEWLMSLKFTGVFRFRDSLQYFKSNHLALVE